MCIRDRLRDEKSVANFDKETFASAIGAIRSHILTRNRNIMAKTAPDAEDDTPLVNEEIDSILERWQRFAEQGGEDLFYGERFMVNPPCLLYTSRCV